MAGADLGRCDLDALVAEDFGRPDDERGVGQDGAAPDDCHARALAWELGWTTGGPGRITVRYNAGMSARSMRELASDAAGGTRTGRLYLDDAWAWSREQADALRRRDVDAIDWENVIGEIEDVGNRHSDAWASHCKNVISHLLRIEHGGAAEAVDHWRKEILAWRREMYGKLYGNPGMKGSLSELLDRAWRLGREDALQALAEQASPEDWVAEKRILRSWRRRLPQECPYSLQDIAGYDPFDKRAVPEPDVWPTPVARRLNEKLGRGYPVPHREPEREGGRSR